MKIRACMCLLIIFALSGCDAMMYKPFAPGNAFNRDGNLLGVKDEQKARAERTQLLLQTRPKCNDSKTCERQWIAARNWVINTCAMKIQTITDGYIETYNSVGANTGLACRVTKDIEPDGVYAFVITTSCGNIFGCVPDSWQAAQSFNDTVNAASN